MPKPDERHGANPSPALRRDERGRLHLLLQPDTSGAIHLSLHAPLFQEDWQNRLTLHSVQQALGAWAPTPTAETSARLAFDATALHENVVGQFFRRDPSAQVACKTGCDHCCHQPIGVTPLEALAILRHVSEQLSPSEQHALAVRVHELSLQARGLSPEARFSPAHPCAFLAGGSCAIYTARPLACRAANSLDAEECRRSLHEPMVRQAFLAGGDHGQTYLEPLRAFHAISAGLQIALSEVHHLDMRPLDLLAAMDLLLGPDAAALVSDWLEGKPAFSDVYGADRRDFV